MKQLLLIIIWLSVSTGSKSQLFEIINPDKVFIGHIGERIEAEILIRNLTDEPLNLEIREIEVAIGSGQQTFLCFHDRCGSETFRSNILKLNGRETLTGVVSTLETGLTPGIRRVKYLIYDYNDTTRSLEHEVTYKVEEPSDSKFIYSSSDLDLREISPNPAADIATLRYDLKNNNTEAVVVLHNILGNVVERYKLEPLKNEMNIETASFNPGVYFYTLYLDGDGISTHKMIIKK